MPYQHPATPRQHLAALAPCRHPEVAARVLALLDRVQHGHRDAFAELYLTFREPVTRYVTVRLRGRDRDAIPGLVQETFTGALADLSDLSAALLDVRGWSIWHAVKACNQHDWSHRRYVRVAYAVRDHEPAAAGQVADGTPTRLDRIIFAHAMARLLAAQTPRHPAAPPRRHPRDAAAQLMDRRTAALRDLERHGLPHIQAALTSPPVAGMNSPQTQRKARS